MNKHIQIREVPDETHRALKARAAAEGLSMSDYLKRMIERELKRPDWAAMVQRMDAMEPIAISGEDIVRAIREERDGR
ncbi:MAG: FitA-like ribbon-helix-helix domain-containing protein [Oceanicaulis sp.]